MHFLTVIILLVASDVPRPWETCVRIRTAKCTASGTIIASNNETSCVLTCAHGFDTVNDKLVVDWFQTDGPTKIKCVGTVSGQVVFINRDEDRAFVMFRPRCKLPASPIQTNWEPRIGEKLISLGCSNGEDATAWEIKLTKVGASRVECEYAPIPGRSGGGLFTKDGYLVGVCIGRWVERRRGVYVKVQGK